MEKLLVITGGGLAPALNATLAGVIAGVSRSRLQLLGGIGGYECLAEKCKFISLNQINPTVLKNRGGALLRSSRTNPIKSFGLERIKRQLKKLNVAGLIAIGGDDTLGVADELQKAGIPTIGIPKTIDNDLPDTYWAPGYPTAAARVAQIAAELKTHGAYALSRIYVLEPLGGISASWLAAAAALGGADVVIPCERKHRLNHVLNIIAKRYRANGNFALVSMAQEAQFDQPLQGITDTQKDMFGTPRTHFRSLALAQMIEKKLGITTRVIYPGNLVETADPIPTDRDWAFRLGQRAVELARARHFGLYLTLVRQNKKTTTLTVTEKSLSRIHQKPHVLDASFFDFKKLAIKEKFVWYHEPIANALPKLDHRYNSLQEKIVRQ